MSPMDPIQFQLWKAQALKKMIQLSRDQLEELLTDFVRCSSLEQREFLYSNLQNILTQDIMEFPATLRNKIFQWLDPKSLLSLRLVSHAWRDEISQLSQWKRECISNGGLVPSKCSLHVSSSCHYYFNFYVRLERVLRLIAAGLAFVVSCPESESSLRSVAFCPVTCSDHFAAYGTSHKGIAGLDADMSTVLWEKAGSLVSCVKNSNDLVLAGTYSGQLRVVSQNGEFDHKLQVHPCSIYVIDVHKSGLYLLIGYSCGTVHLIDENVHSLTLDAHENDDAGVMRNVRTGLECPGIKLVNVKFLSDPVQHTCLLAVTVCFEHYVTFALVDKTTGKLRKRFQSTKTFSPLSSFCLTVSNPCVAYASEGDVNSLIINVWKYEVSLIEIDRTRFQTDRLPADAKDLIVEDGPWLTLNAAKYHIIDYSPLHIIAAGKRFLIAAMLCDIVIFDVENFKPLATISEFLGNFSVRQIYLNHGENCLCAANTDWLDGLSPTNTLPGQTMLVFIRLNLVSARTVIKTLRWNSGLWGPVARGTSSDAAIPHFCFRGGDGEKEPGTSSCADCCESLHHSLISPHADSPMRPISDCDSLSSLKDAISPTDSGLPIQIGMTTNYVSRQEYASSDNTKEHVEDYRCGCTSPLHFPGDEHAWHHLEVSDTAGEPKQGENVSFKKGVWKEAELFHRTVLELRDNHPAFYLERN